MSTSIISAAPCAKCPFRKDVPIYLRLERRREIARGLIEGGRFPCHATVDYAEDDEDEDDTSGSSMCAGAAKAILADGGTTQMMRIAERLGLADLDRVEERGAEVWALGDWQTLAEGATGDEPIEADDEVEPCNTVNAGCEAPAGYAGANGGISYGTESADLQCSECYEPVCSACADDEGRCGICSEEDD